jgi:hypothetical protein
VPPIPSEAWAELFKSVGQAAGPIFFFLTGAYSSQYSKFFVPPIDEFASLLCALAMVAGLLFATLVFYSNLVAKSSP